MEFDTILFTGVILLFALGFSLISFQFIKEKQKEGKKKKREKLMRSSIK